MRYFIFLVFFLLSIKSVFSEVPPRCLFGEPGCYEATNDINYFNVSSDIYKNTTIGKFKINGVDGKGVRDDFLKVVFYPSDESDGCEKDYNKSYTFIVKASGYVLGSDWAGKGVLKNNVFDFWSDVLSESSDRESYMNFKDWYLGVEKKASYLIERYGVSSVPVFVFPVYLLDSDDYPPVRNAGVPVFEDFSYVLMHNGCLKDFGGRISKFNFDVYPLKIYKIMMDKKLSNP